MNNISDIKLGDLYQILDYVTALYDFDDPQQSRQAMSRTQSLAPNVPFIPLEIYTVKIETYTEMIVHRIKILIITGELAWLSLQDNDLPYIFPMTNCDKNYDIAI